MDKPEIIIYKTEDGGLEQQSTMRKIGNSEFSTKPTNYYKLDMVISVGYTLKNSLKESVIFELLKKFFIDKFLKYMRQV